MALVDTALPVSEDFTVPVEGLEAPWGIGQLNLMVDGDQVDAPPTSAAALLAWAKAHPGRFTYPKPPQFHGSSFLKQILLELTPDPAPLYREATDADFLRVTAPLWAWLDQLHPALWRKGRLFPPAPPRPGSCSMTASWPWPSASTRGSPEFGAKRHPAPTVQAIAMEKGAHQQPFPRHPLQCLRPGRGQGGGQLPAEPRRPGAQERPRLLGDPSVLRQEALPGQTRPALRFKGVAEPHPSWQTRLEAAWAERYGH